MEPGILDQEIELFSIVESNEGGELTRTPTSLGTVWGHVITERGSEAFESARVNAREAIRVLLRYRDDVNTEGRLRWMNQTYNIIRVDRSERRKGNLWVTAQVVGAQ